MTRKIKSAILFTLGLLISCVPVSISVISYFPVWQERGAAAVLSGFTLILLLISAAPLFKTLKKLLSSASVWLLWLVIFLIFAILRHIADEMTVISIVGFISNLIGALFFKASAKVGDSG